MSNNLIKGTVKNDRFEMDYFSFGYGTRPLVIIPGISAFPLIDSAESVSESFGLFEKDFKLYLFDRKKDMKEGYSIENMAEDTSEAMKSLGIKDSYVFGASQGGMIALSIGLYDKELIKKALIGSSACRMNEFSKKVFEKWYLLSKKNDISRLNEEMFKDIYSGEYLKLYEKEFSHLMNMGGEKECERIGILSRACLDFDIYDRIDSVSFDCMVIGSEKDNVFGKDASGKLSKKIGCDLFYYTSYSHAVYDEAPDYKNRIYDFFMKE